MDQPASVLLLKGLIATMLPAGKWRPHPENSQVGG
jgi:hypothetical protein